MSTGTSAPAQVVEGAEPVIDSVKADDVVGTERESSSQKEPGLVAQEASPRVKAKYFIVKSLTLEDLELSVRNGVWATQAHNEAALNKAYSVSFRYSPPNKT